MDLSSILSVIHTIIIGPMLNFNGSYNGQGLKNATCKQTFVVFQHCDVRPDRSFYVLIALERLNTTRNVKEQSLKRNVFKQ